MNTSFIVKLLMAIFTALFLCASATIPAFAYSENDYGDVGSAEIKVEVPEWSRANGLYAKVSVSGHNIVRVDAKVGRSGQWYDITSTMDIGMIENNDLYVRAVEADGKVTTYSTRINCFDRTPPTFWAIQEGKNLNIMVSDSESGPMIIYVNGKAHSTEMGTLSYVLSDAMSTAIVQARDVAGNLSDYQSIAIDTSVFAPISRSVTSTSNPTTKAETVYNIQIGDENFTIEQLKESGIPILLFPNVDDQSLVHTLNQYIAQPQGAADEVSPPEETDIKEEPPAEVSAEEPQSAPQPIVAEEPIAIDESAVPEPEEEPQQPVKKRYDTLIILVILVIAFMVILLYRKYLKRKPNTFAVSETDIYEPDDSDIYTFPTPPPPPDNTRKTAL